MIFYILRVDFIFFCYLGYKREGVDEVLFREDSGIWVREGDIVRFGIICWIVGVIRKVFF